METDGLKTVRSEWSGTIIVCGKCSKKLGGGFGPGRRMSLAKALRKHLKLKKGRKAAIGVVESKCLGICPKGAVTVVSSADPHSWRIVSAGADIDVIAETLSLIAR